MELSNQFKSVFSSALGLKQLAMLGDFIFDFIWPARDSVFEESRMEADPSPKREEKRHQTEDKTKRVLLVLLPGLCAYKYEGKLVNHYGFVTGEENGLGEAHVIAKAVVMTV
jgi:hypothetical protein